MDIGSKAEAYWRGLGYLAAGDSALDESATPADKLLSKPRAKRVADD